MIDLEQHHLDEVKKILKQHIPDCQVLVYGSRITGKAKKYSDLDLAIVGNEKLPWKKVEALKDSFSASNIPIIIDIQDWHVVSESFQQIITQNHEILQQTASNN